MGGAVLSAKALAAGYGKTQIIGKLDLEAQRGRVLTLIGPNGAGKSTVLKTLIGQLGPLSGAVYLEGRDMGGMEAREIARGVSAVLTGRPRTELMTCRDVVSSGRYPYTGRLGILSAHDRQVVSESMELVEVSNLAERDFEQISDGQRQRVLLARALCQEPKALVMDEPVSFLDIRHKLSFLRLVRTLAREKELAVVLSLHELDLAQRFSDTLLCVRGGAVDRTGTPEEIFQDGYIDELYGIEHGAYNTLFGGIEAEAVRGAPVVFVLGGGGSGIPAYRALQRRGIPFAAGALPENDADYPVAKALASEVIAGRAFEPVSPEAVRRAMKTAGKCRYFMCTLKTFGAVNAENEKLLRYAGRNKIMLTVAELDFYNFQAG